jgi:hypothetical protein
MKKYCPLRPGYEYGRKVQPDECWQDECAWWIKIDNSPTDVKGFCAVALTPRLEDITQYRRAADELKSTMNKKDK